MTSIGSTFAFAVRMAAADTTVTTTGAPPAWVRHRRHGRGIVGGVICLLVVIYVLWLATRVVRAFEKFADKHRGPPQ
jgi:hypothetical protein